MLAISADDYWDTAFARLPPGIRKADRRLVADSGVLPRLYGAYLCGIPHLGQAESDSGASTRVITIGNSGCCCGFADSPGRRVRGELVSLAHLAPHCAHRCDRGGGWSTI